MGGLLLLILLVPVASGITAIVFTHARGGYAIVAGALGIALSGLIVWFALRVDEQPREAVVSLALIAAVVGALIWVRRISAPA